MSLLGRAFRQAMIEALSGGAGLLLPAAFFVATAMIATLTVGGEGGDTLAMIAPGVLWLGLALAALVTLERVFQADLYDGALDLWLVEADSISAVALVKVTAHWIVSGLPLVLLSPGLGLMLGLTPDQFVRIMTALSLGGLSFYLWGGVAAALSASVARGGLLISLLALPLYVPTLIFGMLTVQNGFESPNFLFLLASTAFALGVAPAAMGAALRLAAD